MELKSPDGVKEASLAATLWLSVRSSLVSNDTIVLPSDSSLLRNNKNWLYYCRL